MWPEPDDSLSFLYFIEASNASLVKIAITWNVKQRYRSLCTMSPVQLKLVRTVAMKRKVAERIESLVHEWLRDSRAHGEWFRIDERTSIFAAAWRPEQPVASVKNYLPPDLPRPDFYSQLTPFQRMKLRSSKPDRRARSHYESAALTD